NPSQTSQSSCTNQKACSKSGYNNQNQCTSHSGVWGYGTWTFGVWTTSTHGVWTPGVWTPGVSGVWTPGVWPPGVWTITGAGVWTAGVWTAKDHSTCNGCVTDRGYPKSSDYLTIGRSNKSGPDTTNNYDENSSTPISGTPSSLFPAEQYGSCPQSLI